MNVNWLIGGYFCISSSFLSSFLLNSTMLEWTRSFTWSEAPVAMFKMSAINASLPMMSTWSLLDVPRNKFVTSAVCAYCGDDVWSLSFFGNSSVMIRALAGFSEARFLQPPYLVLRQIVMQMLSSRSYLLDTCNQAISMALFRLRHQQRIHHLLVRNRRWMAMPNNLPTTTISLFVCNNRHVLCPTTSHMHKQMLLLEHICNGGIEIFLFFFFSWTKTNKVSHGNPEAKGLCQRRLSSLLALVRSIPK